MSWKRWKLGLVISLIIGVFTACAAAGVLEVKINVQFVFFFLGLIGKDVVLFLIKHPADTISFEETPTTQGSKNETGIDSGGAGPVQRN